jgi:hypothetical protein
MAQIPLYYPPPIDTYVQQKLQGKPGLRVFLKRLEDSVTANPALSSPETFVLSNGEKIHCHRKSIRAASYSKTMIFSKDEIVMLYEILENHIRVIAVFFPP